MCKLHMKESVEPPGVETHDNKVEMKETSQAEQSFGNSASLKHMLNDEQQATGRDCDGHTSKEQKSDGLNDKQQLEEQIGNAENTPPHKFHAMFVGLQNMGKSDSESIIDKSSSYINNNSIQCGQRPHTGYNKLISATNLETMLSTCNTHQCLSSETRIQSYGNSEANVGLDNMTLDDFEVNDGVPSVSFMESWLASPKNQAIRSAKTRKSEQCKGFNIHDSEKENTPSSQESPEVAVVGDKKATPSRSSNDTDEDVYIGEHRLSPIRRNFSETIDKIYDQNIVSNHLTYTSSSSTQFTTELQARRLVPPSSYVSSPYDVNISSSEPTAKQIQHYQAIVHLANMQEYKYLMAVQIGKCKVSFETFGNSLKPGGVVEAWVINLYCRILFKNNHPKESSRHTFFHTSSEYFLQKWENEGRRIYLKEQTLKAFDGAGKAKKLHLTDSLHFPSLYDSHWFLFTVDIRDKKFMFMDSLMGKDSKLHKEVDNRMMKNFKAIWEECGLKKVDFIDFQVLHPKVPQQNNGKDCGIYVMKNVAIFKPRSTLMGMYSLKDIPNIRIQIANDMMFSEYNEKKEMQEDDKEFKPALHFPSLYDSHWFLFTVDIRDKKFMFMDSLMGKDSKLHKEVDNRMMKNFKAIWEECGLKKVDFIDFQVLHPKVPQQNNGKDCGIYVMKNVAIFKPRSTLMGMYSLKDIPNIRIQIANDMIFSEYNEKKEMQEDVKEFKPAVQESMLE